MLTMKAKVKFETKEGGVVFKEYPVADLQFKRGAKPEKEDKSELSPELAGLED
jgi:hypothetical protein